VLYVLLFSATLTITYNAAIAFMLRLRGENIDEIRKKKDYGNRLTKNAE
jgi:hypothetical protein